MSSEMETLKVPKTPAPELHRRVLEHAIDMKEKEEEHNWRSLCLTVDKRAITFFSQFFITLIVISFCIVQLFRLESCDSQQAYLGLLTLLIGCFLPQPQFKGNNIQ
jgi:hypothetical protein